MLGALSTGCTYTGSVDLNPAYDIYSNFDDKVPGRWAFSSDASDFVTDAVDMDGIQCVFHTYPLDAKQAFETSALHTFTNLVDDIDLVQNPISSDQLLDLGFKGQIIIRSKNMRAELEFIPGFWQAKAKSNVELTASLQVAGPSGNLVGTTASDDGNGKASAGFACEGGSDAVAEAANEAIKKVLTRLAERFASSDKVRESSQP